MPAVRAASWTSGMTFEVKLPAKFSLVLRQRIIDDTIKGGGQFFRLGADCFRNDGAAASRILAIVGKRQVPSLEQCHDLARLLFQEFLAHHEHVGDEARIFTGAVDHLDALFCCMASVK